MNMEQQGFISEGRGKGGGMHWDFPSVRVPSPQKFKDYDVIIASREDLQYKVP